MRRPLVLLALSISCSNDSGPLPPDGDPGQLHVVSGTVQDSILDTPVAGVRVFIGDSFAMTDSQGQFTTRQDPGTIALLVTDYRYEGYSSALELYRDEYRVRIRLKGQAPYLLSCSFEPTLLTARIVDLQGRKTVNRRGASTITLVAEETSYQQDANRWSWTPVDDLTWLAHIPLTTVGADTAVWRLEDADGHVRSARCANRPTPCTTC
jgi:hypothetical protein